MFSSQKRLWGSWELVFIGNILVSRHFGTSGSGVWGKDGVNLHETHLNTFGSVCHPNSHTCSLESAASKHCSIKWLSLLMDLRCPLSSGFLSNYLFWFLMLYQHVSRYLCVCDLSMWASDWCGILLLYFRGNLCFLLLSYMVETWINLKSFHLNHYFPDKEREVSLSVWSYNKVL